MFLAHTQPAGVTTESDKYGLHCYTTDLYDQLPAEYVTAQVNHSVSRYSSRRRVCNAVDFENDLAVVRQRNSIAVRQRQRSGVVEKCVEIFSPDGIDWSVEHQPDVLAFCLYTQHNNCSLKRYR